MRIFLFMYPTKAHIDWFVQQNPALQNPLKRFNELIGIRYRQLGYNIYWLMFSVKGKHDTPDMAIISENINILPTDRIISAGVSLEIHKEERRHAYLPFVRKQLPVIIEEARLGGFLQYDCVSEIGEHLYRAGIPTLVDEDTTETFFYTLGKYGTIPDKRELTMEGFNYPVLKGGGAIPKTEFLKQRQKEPWLVQPRNLPDP